MFGLSRFFKKELRTVVEWKPADSSILIERYKGLTDEIKNVSDLIVGPGQGCILVQDGQVIEQISTPGKYSIATQNIPFFTTLSRIMSAFESGNKIYLYFYRTTEIVNQRWGTTAPVTYVDPLYKFPIELGAHGSFSAKIADISRFFVGLVGSQEKYSCDDFRKLIISRVTPDIIGYFAKNALSYTEIDKNLRLLSKSIEGDLHSNFERIGIELTDFGINATQLSEQTNEHIQKVIQAQSDQYAAQAVGLDYVGHERIKAMRDVARNEGGLAGAGFQLCALMDIVKETFLNKSEIESSGAPDESSPVIKLKRLKELLDQEIISQEEFDEKKKEYLAQL